MDRTVCKQPVLIHNLLIGLIAGLALYISSFFGGSIPLLYAADSQVSGTYTITTVTQFSSDFSVSVQGLLNANYFAVYQNRSIVDSILPISSKLRSMPQMFDDPAALEIKFFSDVNGTNLVGSAYPGTSNTLIFTYTSSGSGSSDPSGTWSITPITQYSSDFSVSIQGLLNANYFAVYRNGSIVDSILPISSKLRSMPQMFDDPAALEIKFFCDVNGTNLVGSAYPGTSNTLIFAYASGGGSGSPDPSGTWSITPITQFSSDFAVSVKDTTDANYFAVYRYGTIIGSVTPITDKVRSIPQMFSNTDLLEVRFYSDAAGSDLTAKASLNASNQLVFQTEDNCFIATAAFGSKFQPAVVLLRQFRDKCLLSNKPGRLFVDLYYHYSPPAADFIAGSSFLKSMVRILLIPLIGLAYICLHPIWILVLLLMTILGGFMFMRMKNKTVGLLPLIILFIMVAFNVPSAIAATINDVEDNSLRIGYDVYSLSSNNLTNENIINSLLKSNQVYFKIGGYWYDVFAAESDAELGASTYALSNNTVAGWTGLDKWYKEGSEIDTITNITLPTTPTNLTASAAGSTQINLSWTAVAGADSYNIYRATAQAGTYTKIASSSTNSYNNSGLTGSTTYWYKVSAVNIAGEGSFSSLASATTAMSLPGTPTNLTATASGSTQINLSWTAVSGASSYNIYRATTQTGTYTKIATSSTNSYSNTGLTASTTYWYKVSAVNIAGEGSFSSLVSATTAISLPGTPANLTASAAGSNQINLSWTAVSGASSYNIYRATAQAGPYTKIATSNASSCSNSGLIASTTYWYRITAVNSAGESSFSSSVNATTLAGFDTYLNNARTYYSNEQYDEAIAACNQALLLSTSNAEVYVIRGASYLWLGQFSSTVLNDFNAAIAIDPNNAMAYSGKGWYYFYNGLYSNAITQFNSSLGLNSTLAISYEGRGLSYAYSGQPDSALQDFSSFVQYEPDNADAYFLRAATYFELDDNQSSISDYNQAILLDPQDAYAYNNRGAAYHMMGQIQNAINDYLAAVQLDSAYFYAFNNLGVAYSDREEYQNAVNAYNEAISIEPQYALAYSNRGEAYAYLGQNQNALSSWAQAIAIDNELEPAYYCRGWYYLNSNQYSLAVADFTTALQLSANDSEDKSFNPWRSIHYQIGSGRSGEFNGRGWSYYHLDMYNNAISDFTNCLSINPNYANAYDGRGWSYYMQDNYTAAISDFTKCISLDPNNIDALDGRGCSYYWLDQYTNALSDFNKCIALDPYDDYFYDWRGWTYLGLCMNTNAEADFRQCLALNPNNTSAKEGLAELGYTSFSVQSVEDISVTDPVATKSSDSTHAISIPSPEALFESTPALVEP